MAPLPESNTARAYLKYQVDNEVHTLVSRLAPGFTNDDINAMVDDFITVASPLVNDTTFVSLERSVVGSNVRIPVTRVGVTEWGGGGTFPERSPWFWSFTGKSIDGRRARVELFGRNVSNNVNWRLPGVDDSNVQAFIEFLQATEGSFLTISGEPPIWNAYANESISQHWIGAERS